jgi:predicted  nucleic acid-binding Zn-ribbon protein
MGQGMDGMNESWEPEEIDEPQRRRVNTILPEPERLRVEADGLYKRAKKAEEKNKALTAERDQLRAERDAANTRAEAAEQKWDNLRQVVAQLCNDLPKNRDWLDPQIERVLRATAQIDYR